MLVLTPMGEIYPAWRCPHDEGAYYLSIENGIAEWGIVNDLGGGKLRKAMLDKLIKYHAKLGKFIAVAKTLNLK